MDAPATAIALQYWLKKMGYPRLIIAGFLLFLFIMAPITGSDLPTQITNVINRFSWNAVLVLAMVPMIHSGCGLNFGIPLGVLAGLLGGTLAIEMGFTGTMSFLMAIVVSTPFAILFGGGYGILLNKIKGGEMMVATYVGLSSVSFMCVRPLWVIGGKYQLKVGQVVACDGLVPVQGIGVGNPGEEAVGIDGHLGKVGMIDGAGQQPVVVFSADHFLDAEVIGHEVDALQVHRGAFCQVFL